MKELRVGSRQSDWCGKMFWFQFSGLTIAGNEFMRNSDARGRLRGKCGMRVAPPREAICYCLS